MRDGALPSPRRDSPAGRATKLSRTTISPALRAIRRSTMCEPISPAPPVTRTRLLHRHPSVDGARHSRSPSSRRASEECGRARQPRPRTAGHRAVTTAPAPTMAPWPMVTPGRIVAFVPMSAHAPTRTGLISRSVWTIGTSIGHRRCARNRAPSRPVPSRRSPRARDRAHRNTPADRSRRVADDARAVEPALDVGLRADEHAVADLERLEMLEPDAAPDLQPVAAAPCGGPPDAAAHQRVQVAVARCEAPVELDEPVVAVVRLQQARPGRSRSRDRAGLPTAVDGPDDAARRLEAQDIAS